MATTGAYDFFVQWHLTERCTLRCRHCYQNEGGSTELPLPVIAAAIQEAAAMVRAWQSSYGVPLDLSFNISGGEPLLRQDLFEILEEIARLDADIFLLTNGVLVDAGKAHRLAEIGVKGVQVSMEGPRDVHECIRGTGSFYAALTGVRHLVAAGIPVTLNTTLSGTNASRFHEMVPLARSAGAARIGFSRLVPCGRGKTMEDALLDREEVAALYRSILEMEHDGIDVVSGDPVFSQLAGGALEDDCGDIAFGGCAAGISGLTILADGTIVPCRRLPVSIGNVATDSLREVWATSEVLEALRNREAYTGSCSACNRWAACRGCRAIAYAHSAALGHADYLASDPQCFIGTTD